MALSGIGCLLHRPWARWLALGILAVNGMGDVAQLALGHWLEGGVGMVAAGVLIVMLLRSKASVVPACPRLSAAYRFRLVPNRAESRGQRRKKTFQDLILTLQNYWAKQGCLILQPYDVEMGAGTFHPATTLRALGPRLAAAYVQPAPAQDGRYGENPNRLQHYYQYQVILKPAPKDVLDLYLGSFKRSASTLRCTTSASSRTIGKAPRSGPGGSAGKYGATGWRSPSSPISSRSAASIAIWSAPKSLTASSGSPCMCRMSSSSTTWRPAKARWRDVRYGEVFHQSEREFSAFNFERPTRRSCSAISRTPKGVRQAGGGETAAASLRPVHQGFALLRSARRARGDFGDGARRLYRPRADAGESVLRRLAREPDGAYTPRYG